MCRLRNIAMRDYQESVTTGQTDRQTHTHIQTDAGQSGPYVLLCFADDTIVAAFWGMHVSPAKHSYALLPRKSDYRTDRHMNTRTHTDRRRTKWSLCAAMLRRRHKNITSSYLHRHRVHGPQCWFAEKKTGYLCTVAAITKQQIYFC